MKAPISVSAICTGSRDSREQGAQPQSLFEEGSEDFPQRPEAALLHARAAGKSGDRASKVTKKASKVTKNR